MNNAWLLTVTCYENENEFALAQGVFSTEKGAIHELAEWCKGQWSDQKADWMDEDDHSPLEGSDEEVVQKYFEFWNPEEQYVLESHEVDAEL